MNAYKNILVAVELNSKEDKFIMAKAEELATFYQATLFLTHAIESIDNFALASAGIALIELEEKIRKEHEVKFEKLADLHKIPKDRIILSAAPVASSINDAAAQVEADLVITGNHGRHGLEALFGTTASSLIHKASAHKAKYDILVVHLPCKDAK